eukprot:CAMPEP_0197073422 /NCGR_PEP_ID=MMETSP1384-20130603/210599_1 /TAXON_ID=29189 /ORGANISM="Ammonia sp." /LENGTH=266 /DNA_ID=CAMNT_0042512259 /DNA_START=82 /DNA_END=879 /DNA_ORIENTATION=+
MSAAKICDRSMLDWLSSNNLSTFAGDLAKNGIATLEQLQQTQDVDALLGRLKMHSFFANKFKKAFEGIPRGISASPSSTNHDNAHGAKKKVPGGQGVQNSIQSLHLHPHDKPPLQDQTTDRHILVINPQIETMSAANNCDRLLLDWLSSNSLSTIAGDLAKNGIATLGQLKETPDVDALVDRLKMHSFYANKFKKAFEGIPRGISASPSSNNDDNADGAKKKVPGKLNVERRNMSINLSALKPGALPTYKQKRQNEAEKQAKKELI